MKNFETYLQDEFMKEREIGGIPITKDNCEDLFDGWCSNLDQQELIDYADDYGSKKFAGGLIEGQRLANDIHNMITSAFDSK